MYAVSLEIVNSAFFGKPLDWQKIRLVIGTLSFGVDFNSATSLSVQQKSQMMVSFLNHL